LTAGSSHADNSTTQESGTRRWPVGRLARLHQLCTQSVELALQLLLGYAQRRVFTARLLHPRSSAMVA